MSPASSPPVSPATPAPLHGTTVISVRKGKSVVVVADGQVTFGDTVLKANARKTRSLSNGKVIAGFAGATAELDPNDGPFLILDIGGGSTEFVVGSSQVEGALSCNVGCVRLSEKWIATDPPLPEELLACLSVVGSHVDDVVREVPAVSQARTLVGLAGTVSTTAAVELGLAEYDRDEIHHFRISKAAVEDVFRTLATENRSERIQNPGMEEDRADVIVAGLSILVKVMRQLGFDECLVSESDILDGIVADLVGIGGCTG